MSREAIINALSILGDFMKQFQFSDHQKEISELNSLFYEHFESFIKSAKIYNGWFDEHYIRKSILEISKWLNADILYSWCLAYPFTNNPKKIAIIMAGNIPLVGFHDFICTLVSGHSMIVKLSSNEKNFFPLIHQILIYLDPIFMDKIEFTESRMSDFNAVIATGSDNTARYFDYYFGKFPNIIRKNKNSVGILSSDETKSSLSLLAEDIFTFYGLGCRNVSKIYVPKDFDFNLMFECFNTHKEVLNNKKYANNLDYYRALFLMGGNKILDNGFLLLRENHDISSPISILYYQYYESLDDVQDSLVKYANKIQCIVSDLNIPNSIPLGNAQKPKINDYPDGINTLKFLSEL